MNDGVLSKEDLENCENFISKMSASNVIPETHINDVVNSVGIIISDIVHSASAAVTSAFERHEMSTDSEVYTEIQSHLSSLEKPFENLDSSYKRWKHFADQDMVEPCEMSLGVRFETRLNKNTKQCEQIPVEDTFILIHSSYSDIKTPAKTPGYSAVC